MPLLPANGHVTYRGRSTAPRANARSRADDYYRDFQLVYVDQATGDVVLRFHKTDIVRVRPNGDVVLYNGGYPTLTTLSSINDGLTPLDLQMVARGPVSQGNWCMVEPDGRETQYSDQVTVPARTAAQRPRGLRLLRAYGGDAAVATHQATLQRAVGRATAAAPAAAPQPQVYAAPQVQAARLVHAAPQVQVQPPPQPQAQPAPAAPRPAAPAAATPTTDMHPAAAATAPGRAWGCTGPSAAQRLAAASSPYGASSSNTYQAQYAARMQALAAQQQGTAVPPAPQRAAATAGMGAAAGAAAPIPAAALSAIPVPAPAALQSASAAQQIARAVEVMGIEDEPDDHYCVVCMERVRDTVLVPCGHMVLCYGCCQSVMADTRECPICRMSIQEHCRIEG